MASPWDTFGGNFQGGLDPSLIAYYQQMLQSLPQGGARLSDPNYGKTYGAEGNQTYLMDPTGRYRFTQYEDAGAGGTYKDEYGRDWYVSAGGTHTMGKPPGAGGYRLIDTTQGEGRGAAFDSSGKYISDIDLNKGMDGIEKLVTAGVGGLFGAGALGMLGGGAGAAGAGGAGITGFGDAGLMYGGLDGAAAGTLGMGGMGGAAGGTAAMGAGAGGLGSLGSLGSSLTSALGGNSNLLGLGATALGALAGGQGQEASQTSSRAMDPRMDALFYGDLAPKTQGLLASGTPDAIGAGNNMLQKGYGLLGQTAPTTATNPYVTGIMDDMQRRYGDLIDQKLQSVKGNAIGAGGLGGSRQGVAEGLAITQGADNFAGQGFNFMGGLYNQDQNRLRQDWTIGAGLMNQGLNTPYIPAQNAAQIYQPFTGFGQTTNTTQQGGGWQGALGGALGAAQVGKNMGWW